MIFAEPDRLSPRRIADSLTLERREHEGRARALPDNDEVLAAVDRPRARRPRSGRQPEGGSANGRGRRCAAAHVDRDHRRRSRASDLVPLPAAPAQSARAREGRRGTRPVHRPAGARRRDAPRADDPLGRGRIVPVALDRAPARRVGRDLARREARRGRREERRRRRRRDRNRPRRPALAALRAARPDALRVGHRCSRRHGPAGAHQRQDRSSSARRPSASSISDRRPSSG